MTPAKILVREERSKRTMAPRPEAAWYLLGAIGLVFALVSGVDNLVVWYPAFFNDVEWKFGTVTATLNNIPLLALGLVLLLAAAVIRGRRLQVRVVAVVTWLMAIILVGCLLLYLPTLGAAREAVTDPVARLGLTRSIVKTLAQAAMYIVMFGWIGWAAWRYSGTE